MDWLVGGGGEILLRRSADFDTTAPLQHSAVADDKLDCNNHVILDILIGVTTMLAMLCIV